VFPLLVNNFIFFQGWSFVGPRLFITIVTFNDVCPLRPVKQISAPKKKCLKIHIFKVFHPLELAYTCIYAYIQTPKSFLTSFYFSSWLLLPMQQILWRHWLEILFQ